LDGTFRASNNRRMNRMFPLVIFQFAPCVNPAGLVGFTQRHFCGIADDIAGFYTTGPMGER